MPLGNILDAERSKKLLKGINRRRKRFKSISKLKQTLVNQTENFKTVYNLCQYNKISCFLKVALIIKKKMKNQ